LAWHGRVDGVRETFLVHAEESVMQAFAVGLGGRVLMPRLHEPFDL